MARFNLSEEVAALTISLFVAGYCVGPLFWGPLSEQVGRIYIERPFSYTSYQYGRRLIFLVTFPVYIVSGDRALTMKTFDTYDALVFPSWMCTIEEHSIHHYISFARRSVRCCAVNQ
jgi:MFS family permease